MGVLALTDHRLQHLLKFLQSPIFIRGINGLLILWLAWKLAGLIWLLVPQPEVEPAGGEVPEVAAPAGASARIDERQLASLHLFGVAGRKAPAASRPAPVSAPETRLRLTLRGVFAADETSQGRAIIADPKGKEDSYGVGDPLPGGATLTEVHPDRIILERSGRYETLRLPRDKRKAGRPAVISHRSASRISHNSAGGSNAAAFSRYRQEIKQDPSAFLKYVRATPARKNGKFVGFRLQPGPQRGAMKELGLKPGDIVTSINGTKIESPASGMKAMQSMAEGDRVQVTLLRGGKEISLDLTVPSNGG
ncbi:MAG TPA: type II secretion system protein GspC [Gammaproteobacteria bacterium]|nr:type II secretion system protein GspC [Gammaproteobacteria bacterium]